MSDKRIYVMSKEDFDNHINGPSPHNNIKPSDIGASPIEHTHNYAGSSSEGGVANSAAKLEMARAFIVDLASTDNASFDGTKDITPGITGYLSTANGGTGNNLADAPGSAIIRKSGISGDTALWYTPTANGAFFATGANKNASFGTLPIAQGGTGATSANGARGNIGAMGLVKLWTNASGGSNFSPQSISLSLSAYKYIIVEFTVSAGASTHQSTAPIWIGRGAFAVQYENSNGVELRRVTKATTSKVEFEAGKKGETTDNSTMIPQIIWGVKG